MSTMLANALDELLSKRRADGLREEMKKPAEERRDAATVVNAVMDNWLFQTTGVIKKNGEVIRATRLEPSNLRKAFQRILVDAVFAVFASMISAIRLQVYFSSKAKVWRM
jgi:hypothetical protein